jgi:hypothetical protein
MPGWAWGILAGCVVLLLLSWFLASEYDEGESDGRFDDGDDGEGVSGHGRTMPGKGKR